MLVGALRALGVGGGEAMEYLRLSYRDLDLSAYTRIEYNVLRFHEFTDHI